MQFVPDQQTTDFVPPTNLKELVAGLKKYFETNDVNVEQVRAYMLSYKPSDSDWKDKVRFAEGRASRVLLHEEKGKFNLMLICWERGYSSKIHDHSDSHCFMKCIDGSIVEQLFEWPDVNEEGVLSNMDLCSMVKETVIETNFVQYINDQIGIHRVGNTSKEKRAVSMHIYSPPFKTCQVYDHDLQKFVSAEMLYDSRPDDTDTPTTSN